MKAGGNRPGQRRGQFALDPMAALLKRGNCVVFSPDAIALNPDPPEVVLTDLRVFNRSVTPGGRDSPLERSITETRELTISQDLFVLTFEFAALNLVLLGILGVLLIVVVVGWRVLQFNVREANLTRRVEERTRALNELNEKLEQRVAARTAELEEEKKRLAVTLGSIGDAVIATDVDSGVVLMNRVAEKLTGWSIDDAKGRRLSQVMPRLDIETRNEKTDLVSGILGGEGEPSLPSESLLVQPDGTELIIAEGASPIQDQKGHTFGVVLAFRDVTEQRRLDGSRSGYIPGDPVSDI